MTGEITKLIAPAGGTVDYTYSTVTRYASTTTRPARVVTSRVVGGYELTPGTWTFTYDAGTNKDETVVACPCGTTRYRFYGVGLSGEFSAWLSGALRSRTVEHQGTTSEVETHDYVRSELISPDSIPGQNGLWSDADVFAALPTRTEITRQGRVWYTEYTYHWGQGNFNLRLRLVLDQTWRLEDPQSEQDKD